MIELDFSKLGGLVPAIVQDHESGEILMVAFMDRVAWEATLRTGQATYFSRSRNTLWVKGGTSGHTQQVKEILIDCDDDTVVLKVEQAGGAACHTGHRTCFHKRVVDGKVRITDTPVFNPNDVYPS